MAIDSNRDIEMAKIKIEMAGMDKKIALANYFPNISATGAYMFNEKSPALITDELSNNIKNAGTHLQDAGKGAIIDIVNGLAGGNQAAADKMMNSSIVQGLLSKIDGLNLPGMINQIGTELDNIMHPDLQNMVVGAVSLQQPVCMGGKIVAANKIAALAEQLSRTQYEQKYQDVLVGVDQSYWQIVSIANKLKLAEAYSDLLHKLENDVKISIEAGMMTKTDLLEIQVKVNEADMMKLKAINGLSLSKMLLCKQLGIDLNTNITLADEDLEEIPVPQVLEAKDLDEIYSDRPEIKSLELASQIYDKKIAVVRADMIPQIALTANYVMTYPNLSNGFDKSVGGFFNAGVMINIPIFHACEKLNKTRKAKSEAMLYKIQLDDAKNLVNLQVSQLRKQQGEALDKLNMARNNMYNAEENLRTASVGFEAGVVATNTVVAAHTAWLQSHSEFIDAGIELQMNNTNLIKAEGNYVIPTENN